jgi:hypothetical protein
MTVFTCGETLHYQSISTFWTSYVCFCLRKTGEERKKEKKRKRELTKARNDVKTTGHKVNKRA